MAFQRRLPRLVWIGNMALDLKRVAANRKAEWNVRLVVPRFHVFPRGDGAVGEGGLIGFGEVAGSEEGFAPAVPKVVH